MHQFSPVYLCRGEGDPPSWGHEGIFPNPAWVGKFNRSNERPKFLKFPDRKPTICASSLRTLNTQAECGSDEDYWYYAPWRYPGISPVIDPCGVAGGRLAGQGPGSAGAIYTPTVHAKIADLGTKLPPRPSGTVWTAGTDVEVAWTQKAWHGGGYQVGAFVSDRPERAWR